MTSSPYRRMVPEPLDAGEEVTPEMVEAGLQAYVDWDVESEDPGVLLADIYRAMNRAKPN